MKRNTRGLQVSLRDGDDISKALRKFKNKVKDNGTLKLLQEREFYTKPSLVRKREKAVARSRHLKKLSKEKLPTKTVFTKKPKPAKPAKK